MADLGAFLAELRAHGVLEISLKLSPAAPTLGGDALGGMAELGPEALERILSGQSLQDKPAEDKPEGSCAFPGCGAPAGHPFARDLCREHALAAAGVT